MVIWELNSKMYKIEHLSFSLKILIILIPNIISTYLQFMIILNIVFILVINTSTI